MDALRPSPPPAPAAPSLRSWARAVVGAALAGLLLWLAFRRTDWPGALDAARRADPRMLAAALAAILASTALRTARWRVLLEALGAKVPFGRAWRHLNIGLGLSSLVPGRLGELTRAWLAARAQGAALPAVLATVACEITIDVVVVLCLFGSALVFPSFLGTTPGGPGLGALAWAGIGLLGLALVAVPTLVLLALREEQAARWAARAERHLPAVLATPLAGALRSFCLGVAGLRAPRLWLALSITTALAWCSVVAAAWCSLGAFGVDVPPGRAAWFASATTLGMAIPTPGGLGSYHAVAIFVVGEAWGFGAREPGRIAAFAIVSHLIQHLPATLLGAWYLLWEGLPWRPGGGAQASGGRAA